MPPPVDFNALMADLTKCQNALAEIHAGLTRPQEKEILGDLMNRITEARSQVEETYPQTIDLLNRRMRELQSQAEAGLQENARRRQEFEARRKAAEEQAAQGANGQAGRGARPAHRQWTPADPGLAQQLRSELLQQYASPPGQKDAYANAGMEIWESWEDWK